METFRAALGLSLLAFASPAFAVMPTNPVTDPAFTVLPNGMEIGSIKNPNGKLVLRRGDGQAFTSALQAKYEKVKQASQTVKNTPVTWVLMDLDSHRVLAESAESNRKQFGASVNKIFIAGTLANLNRGGFTAHQLELMGLMFADSDNKARDEMADKEVGGGSKTRGQERVQAFTQEMGYLRTRAYRDTLRGVHGNELTALETAEFLYDTYQGRYPGAEYVWKLLHTCRTGAGRARTYLPTDLFVGGKTGTYAGPTKDPETGKSTTVDVKHHSIVFNYGGRQYALTIFANTGDAETTALLAGGLFREFISRR